MPLPPLAPSNTVRGYIDYTSMGVEHTLQFRLPDSSGPNDVSAVALRLAPPMQNNMRTADGIYGVRYSPAGSDQTFPLFWTTIPGLVGPGSQWQEDPESAFISITGRGFSTGRKVRVSLFTPITFGATWPADNRYNVGDVPNFDAWFNTFKAALEATPLGFQTLVTIGGDAANFYDYANIAKNSYWQRKQR